MTVAELEQIIFHGLLRTLDQVGKEIGI